MGYLVAWCVIVCAVMLVEDAVVEGRCQGGGYFTTHNVVVVCGGDDGVDGEIGDEWIGGGVTRPHLMMMSSQCTWLSRSGSRLEFWRSLLRLPYQ